MLAAIWTDWNSVVDKILQQKLNSLLQDKGWLFDPIIVQRVGLLCSNSRQLIIAVGQQFTRKKGVGFQRVFKPVSQMSSPIKVKDVALWGMQHD